jgi:hypothetical protein
MSIIQQLDGGRSEVLAGFWVLLKTLLPKNRNPRVCPATAARNTPPLKDMIANMTI